MHYSLSVLIVTYADRWHLLKDVLNRVDNDDSVDKVILIDNASFYDVAGRCDSSCFKKVKVYRNDVNLGSAGAYSYGLSIVEKDPGSLVFLLDDDNLPSISTISGLIKTYNQVSRSCNGKCVIVSYRRSVYQKELLRDKRKIFLEKENFLGFNLFNFFQRKYRKFTHVKTCEKQSSIDFTRDIGAAYGGMFFSANLMNDVGLPCSNYVLYFDDHEYSIRLKKAGYKFVFDLLNIIEDIEENCSASFLARTLVGFVINGSDSKSYYYLRNKVYVDKYILEKKGVIYIINKYLFFFLITFLSIVMLKTKRSIAVVKALFDGNKGSLGFNKIYKL